MSRSQGPSVLYASQGYTNHDRRFLAAAIDQGFEVAFARFDGGRPAAEPRSVPPGVVEVDWLGSVEALRPDNVERFVDAFRDLSVMAPQVVHAGPVPTVGFVAVAAAIAPVVVMSWAWDLLIDAHASLAVQRDTTEALVGAAGVLVDCESLAVAARALGAPGERITIVPWGIDLDPVPYLPPSPHAGALRLLSLRSLEPLYDIDTLLDGLAQARADGAAEDFVLTIAGSGSQEADLKAAAERLGVSAAVRWLGRVPEHEVPGLLRDHDIHVSTSRSDGTSISLLQAMAVGRPSIVTDLASNREWITPDETGWLFEPGDSASLAGALRRASARRNDFEAMARRARATVERRADWSKNRRRIAALYERLAGVTAGVVGE